MRLLWILGLCLGLACPSGIAYDVGRFPGKGSKADFEKASTLNDKGDQLLTSNKPKEALAFFQRAIQIYPYASIFYSNSGVALSALKNKDAAIQFYKKAISVDSSNVNAISSLGYLYREKKRYPEAAKLCQQALDLEPTNPAVQINMAEVLIETGKFSEGKKLLFEAQRNPNSSEYSAEIIEWINKANTSMRK